MTILPNHGGGSDTPGTAVQQCENWIDLRYEYEDGTGVAGAAYVVQEPNGGEIGGAELASGTLDANGEALRVCLPLDKTEVEVFFHDNPDGEPYEDPDARQDEEPEPGFFRSIWEGVTDAISWTWGVLQGDFNEDASTSQIIANTILTMIPGIDQLGDARDVVSILYRMIWKREYAEVLAWVALFITLIGLIPVLGSLAKGILKLVLRQGAKLADLLKVFNWFSKGNGYKWVREFSEKLTGEHLQTVISKLNELLDRTTGYLREAKGFWLWSGSSNRIIDDMLGKIGEFRGVANDKLRAAADHLKTKLDEIIAKGLSRVQRTGTKRKFTLRQQKVEPPNRVPSLSQTKIDEILATPKGQRPDPSTYMSQAEIDEHLARFDNGAVRFRDTAYDSAGPPGGFVMPRDEFERMVEETGGDLSQIEDRLGLTPGHLSSGKMEPVLIEADDFSNIRVPSGNEGGANEHWLPGGFTSGGAPEAVMDFDGVDFTPIILD